MIAKVLSGLLVAWIFSLFGFDDMVLEMFKQFGFEVTTTTYYVLFAILGLLTTRYNKD